MHAQCQESMEGRREFPPQTAACADKEGPAAPSPVPSDPALSCRGCGEGTRRTNPPPMAFCLGRGAWMLRRPQRGLLLPEQAHGPEPPLRNC